MNFEKMQNDIFAWFENIESIAQYGLELENEMFVSKVKQTIEDIEDQLTGIKERIKKWERQF